MTTAGNHRKNAVCNTCTVKLVRMAYRRAPWFRLVREPLKLSMRLMAWLYRVDPTAYEVRTPACYRCMRFHKVALKERSAAFRWLNSRVNPHFDALLERIVTPDEVQRAQAYARAATAGQVTPEQASAWMKGSAPISDQAGEERGVGRIEPAAGALGEVVRLFLRLGFTAFGGPAAHIAMMHEEVVVRRRWLEEQRFLDLVGATNLIPGPNSTEMAIHIGYLRAGWRGLLAAGLCFILPAAFIVGTLAWAYVRYGSTPQGVALMYGIKPVIIAIVLQALYRLGRSALKGPWLAGAAVAALLLYLLGVHELVVLFGGALLVLAVRTVRRWPQGAAALLPLVGLASGLPQRVEPVPVRLGPLFLIFLKIGAVLYGSGYVLLAFLRNDLVLRLGWLTDRQLLDAVAVGQFTPGPVFTTATFVGYLLAGLPGAVLATVGIFLPSFCFVALLARLLPVVRNRPWTAALLDGVNVSALGLMAGVTWQLARSAMVDLPTLLLAVGAAALLFRFKVNSAWLVVAGGVVGLALG